MSELAKILDGEWKMLLGDMTFDEATDFSYRDGAATLGGEAVAIRFEDDRAIIGESDRGRTIVMLKAGSTDGLRVVTECPEIDDDEDTAAEPEWFPEEFGLLYRPETVADLKAQTS